jgi:hypothetical protein
MSNRHCCAKCKTPYNCGNPGCACHAGSFEDQAAWAAVLEENRPDKVQARYNMDHYRSIRDPNGDDMSTAGYLHRT